MGAFTSVHFGSAATASTTSGALKSARASSKGNGSGSGCFFVSSLASTPSMLPCS